RSGRRRARRPGRRTAGTAARGPAAPACAAWTGRRSRAPPANSLDDPELRGGGLAAAGARLGLPPRPLALDLEDQPRRALAAADAARAPLVGLPLQRPQPARDGASVAHAASPPPTTTSGCVAHVIRSQTVRCRWTS